MAEVRPPDVYIDNNKFTVRQYQSSTANNFVSNFGSAEQGQTNLDLLKASTQKSFRGGMFQKKFKDEEMVNFAKGAHYNPLDEKLYFTPEWTSYTKSDNMSPEGVTAHAVLDGALYIAYRNSAPTIVNRMRKIDLETGVASVVALPAIVANAVCPITTICIHKGKLFIGGESILSAGVVSIIICHRYLGSGTWQNIDGGIRYMVSWRGKLYGVNNGMLFLITNEFAAGAATFTKIDDVFSYPVNYNYMYWLRVYNNALYMGSAAGLFRYDGVAVQAVFDDYTNISAQNYRLSAVFNGRLYYVSRDKLYEFDGINVRLIQDFSETYIVQALEGGSDRLWLTVRYNKTSSAIYDLANFSSEVELENFTYGLVSFNGIGFFEYRGMRFDTSDPKDGGFGDIIRPCAIAALSRITWIVPDVYYNFSLEVASSGYFLKTLPLSNDYSVDGLTDGQTFEVYGSSFDAGYPSVSKCLSGIKLDYDGFDDENSVLELQVRTVTKGVTSDWIMVWNSDNVSSSGISSDYSLPEQSIDADPSEDPLAPSPSSRNLYTEPLIFDSIEYKLVGKINDVAELPVAPKVSNVTYRYTLQPEPRKKWILTLNLEGKNYRNLDTPVLADGSSEVRSANYLRGVIESALKSKKPILFLDCQYSALAIGSDYLINGGDWVDVGDVVAFQNDPALLPWVHSKVGSTSFDSGTDKTTLTFNNTGLRVGVGGENLADSPSGTELRKSYVCQLTRIINENVLLGDETFNVGNRGYTDLASSIQIELQEV